MKRSLSLISFILVGFLICDCQNKINNETHPEDQELKTAIDTPAMSMDTIRTVATPATPEGVIQETELTPEKKKVVKPHITIKEAPKHSAPEQTAIDSIKQAKLKLKK